MTRTALLAKQAETYAQTREWAIRDRDRGNLEAARVWAKHARADFRQLCRVASMEHPTPHHTADVFRF